MSSLTVRVIQLAFIVLAFHTHCIEAINNDGAVLLSLLNKFSAPPTFFSSWNSSDMYPCHWKGVTCHPDHTVRIVDLTQSHVSGTLSSAICGLHNLKELYLGSNNLSGTIPPELGNCTELQSLDLSNNGLHGQIPVQLGSIKSLRSLSLYDNFLSGSIPLSIFGLPLMEVIYLSTNNLSGEIPSNVGNLTQLSKLWFGENSLVGEIPSSIASCEHLTELYVHENQLVGELPQSLGRLSKLQYLYVTSNNLGGHIPKSLGDCTNLNEVELSNNQFSGEILWEIGNCSNLTMIFATQNQLIGRIPSSLGSLQYLTQLYLNENLLSGGIPAELGNCSLLEELSLHTNKLEGFIPPELGRLGRLKILFLSDNSLHGPIPPQLFKARRLRELYLYNNSLTGSISPKICNLTQLRFLFLFDNQLSGSIPAELGAHGNLRGIDLTRNRFNGTIPPALCSSGRLEILDVGNNQLEGNIPPEIGRCRSLKRVILSNNNLTGTIPSDFIGSNSIIDYLDMSDNKLQGKIPWSLGHCRNLSFINLSRNQLNGTLPAELGQLSKLLRLNLSSNILTGPLPQELGNTSLLYSLDLSFNSFNGSLPDQLASLQKLQYLILQGNRFGGSIPAWLSDLGQLMQLNMGQNQFQGQIPSSLGNLGNLYMGLNIGNNRLSGTIPEALGNLDKLERMDLSSNNLSGIIPSALDSLLSLDAVNISNNQLSGCLPKSWLKLWNSSSSSFTGNPDLCATENQGSLCKCRGDFPLSNKEIKHPSKVYIVLAVIGAVMLSCFLVAVILCKLLSLKRRSRLEIDAEVSAGLQEIFQRTENLSDRSVFALAGRGIMHKYPNSYTSVTRSFLHVKGESGSHDPSVLTLKGEEIQQNEYPCSSKPKEVDNPSSRCLMDERYSEAACRKMDDFCAEMSNLNRVHDKHQDKRELIFSFKQFSNAHKRTAQGSSLRLNVEDESKAGISKFGGAKLQASIRNEPAIIGGHVSPWMQIDIKDLIVSHKLIGNGSDGAVYEGSWLGVKVVLRILHIVNYTTDEERQVEVAAHAKLYSPFIVQLINVCVTETLCYLVMELVSSSLDLILKKRLERNELSLPLPVAVDMMLQISRGTEYLHSQKVMHMDLKAANVLVQPSAVAEYRYQGYGRVKLCDFGHSSLRLHSFRCSDWAKGTSHWRAPEVFEYPQKGLEIEAEPLKEYNYKADVYSLSMTCYEILTGKPPFEDFPLPPKHVFRKIVQGEGPSLPSSCPLVLADYIRKCWDTDPRRRPRFPEVPNF